jgi:hypothetical protein
VTLLLNPSTSLEGTVLDEEGRPMQGVVVRAGVREVTTGHEGRYRIEHLTAGPCSLSFRIPTELRKKTLTSDDETGEILGYPSVEFYPGVADARAATTIQIAGGMDLHGYDVRLRRVRLTYLSGRTLARAGGDPLASASVELQTPGSSAMTDDTFQSRAVNADGSFQFELIQPGSYVLLIYRGERGMGLPYIVPVEVGKTGVQNKDIVVPQFQQIEGSVKSKDGEGWNGEVGLVVTSRQKGVSNRYLTIKQAHFLLEDIPPGEWTIILNSFATLSSPARKLAVTAARAGRTDLLAGPLIVTESGNPPVEVELSSDTGRIAGVVSGRHQGSILVRRVGPTTGGQLSTPIAVQDDGTFLVDALAPGRYDILFLGVVDGNVPIAHAEVKSGETAVVRLDVK